MNSLTGRSPRAPYRIERSPASPIIRPHMDDRMGDNINGPSLIRVPDWVERPLGRYYLYFSHHEGDYIRLAYADDVEGPWTVYRPGVLSLEESGFPTVKTAEFHNPAIQPANSDWANPHIASPDVHVDHERREIRMYFHGLARSVDHAQRTRVALSPDGLHFTARSDDLGPSYFRVFRWDSVWYAWSMPGIFHRSPDGLTPFTSDPTVARMEDDVALEPAVRRAQFTRMLESLRFPAPARHGAVRVVGSTLQVAFSMVGDAPERIKFTSVDLRNDWTTWTASEVYELLEPETDDEGADLEPERSVFGAMMGRRSRELRDPCFFEYEGRLWLCYSVAGEFGIGLAGLHPAE